MIQNSINQVLRDISNFDHKIINANSNHSYKWINVIMNISQVEIRLINIDQAKEVLVRIPIARVKLSETYV